MADKNTIARPYAEAIFELASESDSLDELSKSLNGARDLLCDGQVAKLLGTPTLTDEQRLSFLTELFSKVAGKSSVFAGGNKHGTNFLKLLLGYGRVSVLPEIANHFDTLKANVENKDRLGREINLDTEIDESLIGGAVIRAGDVVIDGSLRARLEGLADALVT
jgi:F-type H+-transporting ATPase subunit delta